MENETPKKDKTALWVALLMGVPACIILALYFTMMHLVKTQDAIVPETVTPSASASVLEAH